MKITTVIAAIVAIGTLAGAAEARPFFDHHHHRMMHRRHYRPHHMMHGHMDRHHR